MSVLFIWILNGFYAMLFIRELEFFYRIPGKEGWI